MPIISGTLSITGQFVVTGTFTSHAAVDLDGVQTPAPSSTTCASFANGYAQQLPLGGTGFDAPIAKTNGPTAVSVSVSLATGYLGPGTYDSGNNPFLSGTATVTVTTAQGPSYYVFHSHGSGTTLHVTPDGSGSVQLTGWVDDETRGGNGTGLVTGVMTWTCR